MLPVIRHATHPAISGQVGPLVTVDGIRNKGLGDLEGSKSCRVFVLEIKRAFLVPVQEHPEDQLRKWSVLSITFYIFINDFLSSFPILD